MSNVLPVLAQDYEVPANIVYPYLNGAGNHELKNVIAMLMLSQPDITHTNEDLAAKVMTGQGDPSTWHVKPSRVETYAIRSLWPVGEVISPAGPVGREADSWRVNREQSVARLALGGFISDWSIRWPEISVQQVLGATTSPSEIRSPHARSCIYDALIYGKVPMSIIDLVDTLDGKLYDNHAEIAIQGQVNTLEKLNIISKQTNRRGDNPILKILSTEPIIAETIPETQALYRALGRLGVGTQVDMNTLITTASEEDAGIDTVKLHWLLRHVDAGSYPGLSFVEPKPGSIKEQSAVAITPEFKEPIRELVVGIRLATHDAYQPSFIARAKEILTTQKDFRALVAKARQFSARANSQGRQTDTQHLKAIINDLQEATAETARNELIAHHNRTLSLPHLRTILNDMSDIGILERDVTIIEPHSKLSANIYRIAANQQNT